MTTKMTRDPLPGPATCVIGETCPTCNRTEIASNSTDGWEQPMTRSVEPDNEGRYSMQPHEPWCPVGTEQEPARVPCPQCGTQMTEIEFRPGREVQVEEIGPNGELVKGWLDIDAADRHPFASPFTKSRRAQWLDSAVVGPCRHFLRDNAARQAYTVFLEAKQEIANEEAVATLAQHADLIEAARAHGGSAVVDAYATALRSGSREASGLLAAIRALAGESPIRTSPTAT